MTDKMDTEGQKPAEAVCESCDGTGHDLYGGTLNPVTFNLADCTVCHGTGLPPAPTVLESE